MGAAEYSATSAWFAEVGDSSDAALSMDDVAHGEVPLVYYSLYYAEHPGGSPSDIEAHYTFTEVIGKEEMVTGTP